MWVAENPQALIFYWPFLSRKKVSPAASVKKKLTRRISFLEVRAAFLDRFAQRAKSKDQRPLRIGYSVWYSKSILCNYFVTLSWLRNPFSLFFYPCSFSLRCQGYAPFYSLVLIQLQRFQGYAPCKIFQVENHAAWTTSGLQMNYTPRRHRVYQRGTRKVKIP